MWPFRKDSIRRLILSFFKREMIDGFSGGAGATGALTGTFFGEGCLATFCALPYFWQSLSSVKGTIVDLYITDFCDLVGEKTGGLTASRLGLIRDLYGSICLRGEDSTAG